MTITKLLKRFGFSNLLILSLLVTLACWGFSLSSAQDQPETEPGGVQVDAKEEQKPKEAPEENGPQDEIENPANEESDLPESAIGLPQIELNEPDPEIGLYDRVDGAFGEVVGFMYSYLFYPVFYAEREYIQYEQVIDYVRPKGSKSEFTIHQSTILEKPADFPNSITLKEANNYNNRGQLIVSTSDRPFRFGKLGDQEVEFVSVVVDNSSTYVKVTEEGETTFRKKSSLRDKLSKDSAEWLTEEQVAKLGDDGFLKLNKSPLPETPVYILSKRHGGAPLVVLWLSCGAVIFTFYMGFVNIWGFKHAVEIVRGTYDNPDEPGEVTHFQALASALSATVGLGNIAGVTIAMTQGGPGAFFWMLFCGLFGMTSKFVECTLGQKYREVKPDGTVLGGPMQYLQVSFEQFGLKPVGVVVSIVFAIMCILASFGGGNMFQANQSSATVLGLIQAEQTEQIAELDSQIKKAALAGDTAKKEELQIQREDLEEQVSSFGRYFKAIFGVILAILVALVILGGIKRIGAAASKIVPTMCLMYIVACLWIIFSHLPEVPALVMSIFTEAFNPQAIQGGIMGVLVIGVQRAAFSNEAGVGSAAIAHSAAKTEEPVREGMVALLGPFIDTVVVCSMTALVILITGAWNNEQWILNEGLTGAQLTSKAFGDEISFFPYVLTVAVVLFAYSTIISWSYYGERCWERLFGPNSTAIYKAIYVGCVILGSIANLGAVLDFSDMMILSMAFPNILGAALLLPYIKQDLRKYWKKYTAGEFKKYK